MINNVSSLFPTVNRNITAVYKKSSFSVSPQKITLNPVKISSPFSPSSSSISATTLFRAPNAHSASFHRQSTAESSLHQQLPNVRQRLIQHLAEHGIKPARSMAEHIPPAPNWPAPPPPVQNEQSRPLPDVAQRLVQHLAEHGIQPARSMAEHIPPAPNWPAPPLPVQNEQSRPLPDVAQRLVQHLAEHGIQPARSMAEHIPPAPNWPAPPPPVQNEQSRP
ncbi:Tir-cytoskeleton coupling protein TccP, partial [Escherichia coli]|nr:Tir-cytoskeleton coupling protein TccP [Escherichia coli]